MNYDKCVVDMTAFLEVRIALMIKMNEYNCEKYSYETILANCCSK